jgi:hypothetical protein
MHVALRLSLIICCARRSPGVPACSSASLHTTHTHMLLSSVCVTSDCKYIAIYSASILHLQPCMKDVLPDAA